jgi:hypothetical protein
MASFFVGFGGSDKIYLVCLYSSNDQPKHSKLTSSVLCPSPMQADCLIFPTQPFCTPFLSPLFVHDDIVYCKYQAKIHLSYSRFHQKDLTYLLLNFSAFVHTTATKNLG